MAILGEIPGDDLNRVFISFPSVSPQGRGLMVGCCQGRGSLFNASGPKVSMKSPVWFCCFSGHGTEIQLRPRCYLLDVISRVESPGEERLLWGWGPCLPSFAPCQVLGALCPGDHLHLAADCSASLFSYQSVSLLHLPRNCPNFPLSCLNTRLSLFKNCAFVSL